MKTNINLFFRSITMMVLLVSFCALTMAASNNSRNVMDNGAVKTMIVKDMNANTGDYVIAIPEMNTMDISMGPVVIKKEVTSEVTTTAPGESYQVMNSTAQNRQVIYDLSVFKNHAVANGTNDMTAKAKLYATDVSDLNRDVPTRTASDQNFLKGKETVMDITLNAGVKNVTVENIIARSGAVISPPINNNINVTNTDQYAVYGINSSGYAYHALNSPLVAVENFAGSIDFTGFVHFNPHASSVS